MTPGVTSAPAATMAPFSTVAPSISVAPIPTNASSFTTHACRIALCPIVTRSPMIVGIATPPTFVFATWTTALSWMLVSAPTRIRFTSPRSTAPYHTEDRSPITTSPITDAEGATKPTEGSAGVLSYTARTVLCLLISSRNAELPCMEHPTRSRAWPVSRRAVPRANMMRDIDDVMAGECLCGVKQGSCACACQRRRERGSRGVRNATRWREKDERPHPATEKIPATNAPGWPQREASIASGRARAGKGAARARARSPPLAATAAACSRGDASPRRRGAVDARTRARRRKSWHSGVVGLGHRRVGARVRAVFSARRDAGWGGRDRRRTLT